MTAQPTSNAIHLDPRTYARGRSCVHCGLCLPACPTYTQTFNEADSPRGRIQLMLALADGAIAPTDSVLRHLNLCLDCRGCETACPSGVIYHELIEESRTRLAITVGLSTGERFLRWIFLHILAHPLRLKLAMLPGRLVKKLGLLRLLPGPLRKMVQMLPATGSWWPRRLPVRSSSHRPSAIGHPVIAFFPGCVGSVVYDSVNRKAIELLSACGAEVIVPPNLVCCGAIHHHNAAPRQAEDLARRNIDTLLPPGQPWPDCITTAIAGCGAMLRQYAHLLRDDPAYADRAGIFVGKIRDISEVLLELGLPTMSHAVNETAAYHDACHLAHAQGVTVPPRKLLSRIPGLKLVPMPESDICCGAAGTYNLVQPEMATELARRKLRNFASTGAGVFVAANVGCAMHLQAQADSEGIKLRIVHPVELLHQAAFGPATSSLSS